MEEKLRIYGKPLFYTDDLYKVYPFLKYSENFVSFFLLKTEIYLKLSFNLRF